MPEIACPHCTFLNRAGRKKCAMCLKLLDVRTSATPTSQTTDSHSTAQPSPPTSVERTSTRKRLRSETDDEATAPPVPSPGDAASDAPVAQRDVAPKLNTFFSTASGRPVQVSKTALDAAAQKLSEFDGAAQSRDSGASESEAEQNGGSTALVATFFSTAGGRPVKVKAANLERAQEKFELKDDATADQDVLPVSTRARAEPLPMNTLPQHPVAADATAQIATLFSTAGGAAVRVSAAALAQARAKFDDQNESPSEDDSTPSRSDESSADGEDCAGSPGVQERLQTHAAPALGRPAPSTLQGMAAKGPRRGFVPPQRMAPAPARAVLPATHPHTTTHAVASSLSRKTAGTRLTPLVFRNDVFASDPPAHIPTHSELSPDFHFTFACCGIKMREAMGVEGGQVNGDACVNTEHFRQLLLSLGASRAHCTPEWCGQVLLSALFKAASVAHSTIPVAVQAFTPGAVAVCLCQKYNTEIVDGRRPVLRQMTEGDVPSVSLATVYVSAHCQERAAPHTNIVRLSDGYYHLKATLDLPLSTLLRQGALPVGQRLAICGSRCVLPSPCSPWECLDRTVLSLNYNGVRPVSRTSPLGVARAEPQPLPVSLVHPMGGLVPVLQGIVSRVMPPFFVTSTTVPTASSSSGVGGDAALTKVVRNWHAQVQHVDQMLRNATATAQHGLAATQSAGSLQLESGDGPRVARVTSVLIVDSAGNEALIQQWENCTEEASVAEPDSASGPVEGSKISMYGLMPAKAFTAFAPFTSAKLFHASRQLRYTVVAGPASPTRVISTCLNDPANPFLMGAAVDVVGLFLGSIETDQGMFVLLLQEQDCYVFLQIPVASARSKLTFALPSTVGVPVVVEHAVFVSREDGDAGSDCARVFAKEYTRVVQRSVQPLLSKSLQQAAPLVVTFSQRRHKYEARRQAIFNNLRDSLASPGRVPDEYARPSDAAALSARGSLTSSNGELFVPEGLNFGSVAGAAKSSRVPYYLRTASTGNGGAASGAAGTGGMRTGLGGVVLLESRPPPPRTSAAASPDVPGPTPSLSAASYGNVVSLQLHWEFLSAEHRKSSPVDLLVPGDDDEFLCPPAPHREDGDDDQRQWLPVFTVTWRHDAADACTQTATIRTPTPLDALLEPCVGLQRICNITAAQKEVESSLHRHALLRRWRKENNANELWWRVLSCSKVANMGSDDDLTTADTAARMTWQPVEWATVKSTLKQSLEGAFFRFNADPQSGHVRSIHFITGECRVTDLV